jgi:hypothetical protein
MVFQKICCIIGSCNIIHVHLICPFVQNEGPHVRLKCAHRSGFSHMCCTYLPYQSRLSTYQSPKSTSSMNMIPTSSGSRASYAPPEIRNWVQSLNPEPQRQAIDIERYRQRHGISTDGFNEPHKPLHPHFCLKNADRHLAWHEGITDIRDAVSILHTSILSSFQLTHIRPQVSVGLRIPFFLGLLFGQNGILMSLYIGLTFMSKPSPAATLINSDVPQNGPGLSRRYKRLFDRSLQLLTSNLFILSSTI